MALTEEVIRLCEEGDIPCGPVCSIESMLLTEGPLKAAISMRPNVHYSVRHRP